MLLDESVEDSFHVHSSAECTTSSSLLEELVSPSCPMTCKIASSANIPIQNQLNSNDLEYHKKYPNVMDHSYVGVCVEYHTPPTGRHGDPHTKLRSVRSEGQCVECLYNGPMVHAP